MNVINDLEKLIGKSINNIPKTFFKYIIGYKYKNCGMRYPVTNFKLAQLDYFNPIAFDDLFTSRKLIFLWYDENFIITDLEIYDIFDDLEVLVNDYEDIIKMIDNGEAHNLRQGQTKYLGAGKLNVKCKQPNNDVCAFKREFVLKKYYLQKILNQIK